MASYPAGWTGLIHGRTDPADRPVVELPLRQSTTGGSGTFLARASDGRRWWVKPQNNPQGPRVIVTEYLVGSVGALLGAPTCEVTVIEIPEDLVGWEYRPGHTLEAGLACGSAHIDDVVEDRQLLYRDRDDNRRRHAGVFALSDWCWGEDHQWLYCAADDLALHSHDHGWYLPEPGPDWSDATLTARVADGHVLAQSPAGLDRAELARLSARLRSLTRDQLQEILQSVPASWPVTDSELESVGAFLEERCWMVAGRLDGLAAVA